MATSLPTEPGFYWWRKNAMRVWRMIQVIDYGGGQLMTYDVETHEWSGRSIDAWREYDVIGEWIAISKPQ